MVQCPACLTSYAANTIFCLKCGLFPLENEEISLDPVETSTPGWGPDAADRSNSSGIGHPTIRLRIRASKSLRALSPSSRSLMTSGIGAGQWNRQRGNRAGARELEIPLTKPVCLGRIDPKEGVYPDIDLTADLAMEFGVSREHACIYRRSNAIEVEDLASTNGTMLNGTRLSPYLSVPLKDGDQLQLGKLLIEVSFGANHRRDTTTEIRMAAAH
jgi:hypothetical protein